jgi:hypothetical protein
MFRLLIVLILITGSVAKVLPWVNKGVEVWDMNKSTYIHLIKMSNKYSNSKGENVTPYVREIIIENKTYTIYKKDK